VDVVSWYDLIYAPIPAAAIVTTATRSQVRCFGGDDTVGDEVEACRLCICPTDLERLDGELNRDEPRAEVLGFMESLEKGMRRVSSRMVPFVLRKCDKPGARGASPDWVGQETTITILLQVFWAVYFLPVSFSV
jgi:hypothetical protein